MADPSGRGIQATIHIVSRANQYSTDLETDKQGNLNLARLPYGSYLLGIEQDGFAPVADTVAIRSSIPVAHSIVLKLATVSVEEAGSAN